jgi:PAS domain S-box-containing protein
MQRPSYLQDTAVRTILDASPTSIVGVDADGVICYANELTAATFGWSADELVGRPVEVLVPERLVERHRRHRAELWCRVVGGPQGTTLTSWMPRSRAS